MEMENGLWADDLPVIKDADWPAVDDPGYSMDYAELFEQKEDGIAETFTFENEKGRVDHVYIKRTIPINTVEGTYFDITTPYGYGGPVIVYGEDTDGLLKDYYASFREYCREHRIVSEFVRFHLFESREVREQYYGEVSLIGSHITKPLSGPLKLNMSSDVQRCLKKADKMGMTIHVDATGDKVSDFLDIYYDMLNRNQASSYYRFNRTFFDEMHKKFSGRFVYVSAEFDGKVISSRLAIYGKRYGFGFLGGTLKDYFYTQATTVVDYHVLNYLKSQNCSYFSFGGGINGKDGIYNYKRKFNKMGDHPFYVGRTIHLPEIYDELVSKHSSISALNHPSSFFPLYRA